MVAIKKAQKSHQDEDGLKVSFMMAYPYTDTALPEQKNLASGKIDFFKLGKEIVDGELRTAMEILARKSN